VVSVLLNDLFICLAHFYHVSNLGLLYIDEGNLWSCSPDVASVRRSRQVFFFFFFLSQHVRICSETMLRDSTPNQILDTRLLLSVSNVPLLEDHKRHHKNTM